MTAGDSEELDPLAKVVHSGRSRRNDVVSPLLDGRVADVSRRVESVRRRVTRLSVRRREARLVGRPAGANRGIGVENERGSTVSDDARRAVATNGNEA